MQLRETVSVPLFYSHVNPLYDHCSRISLYYYIIVLLYHSIIISLFYYIVLLYHCFIIIYIEMGNSAPDPSDHHSAVYTSGGLNAAVPDLLPAQVTARRRSGDTKVTMRRH